MSCRDSFSSVAMSELRHALNSCTSDAHPVVCAVPLSTSKHHGTASMLQRTVQNTTLLLQHVSKLWNHARLLA
jgi:hypothetical protein